MQELGVEEFGRRLKMNMTESDGRFIFFLGSGCSVSSGIPTAAGLVKNWLPRLKKIRTGREDHLADWLKKEYPDYKEENAASFYGKVMEALFLHPEERQREIERLTEGKDPGFGYAVLAQIMSHPSFIRRCNIVLTTNFDDLVADALYLYTFKKPLIIAHESLVGFVRITRTIPVVIKLHGDARLTPKNTELETQDLTDAVKRVLKNLLHEAGLIFVGYGGNDQSILNILRELPTGALPWGVYWVNAHLPENEMGEWLEQVDAKWVRHLDFDELMLLIRNEFDLTHPDLRRFEKLRDTYQETFKNLTEKIEAKPESKEKRLIEEAAEKAAKDFDSWFSVELEARKFKKSDPNRAKSIYEEGLKQFPDHPDLLGNYAIFMQTIRNDYEAAEEYYRRALEADPKHANNLGNYAVFLQNIRKDYEGAEEYYRRALEADPKDANNLGNYAVFLKNIRKDYEAAEEYYSRALEADPNHANNLSNYAGFLLGRGDSEGLKFLKQALKKAEKEPLLLECLFYRYAHDPDPKARQKSLDRIKELIKTGVRSPGWNLEDNVTRAIQDGHPEPQFLESLAKVIADEMSEQELEKFEVWKSA
ncbi:MAG: tetratricopeptide repeat protein [Syntrophobacterales bacterium]|jgi:Tfp pilus assembly protein PilF